MKGIRFIILSLVILTVLPAVLCGVDFKYEGIDGEIGFLWKHNEGYDTEKGDCGPDLFKFFPGVSAFFTFNEHWFLKPSFFVYTETLQYLPERDYTIPVDHSNIDSMTVLAMTLEPAGGYRWTVGKRHTFGVQTGLGFQFQIPLVGPGDDDRSDMLSSLLKEWLYLTPGFWYYNPLTERFAFTFRTEVGIPLYNTFINRDLPFSDGLTVMGMVGIRVLAR